MDIATTWGMVKKYAAAKGLELSYIEPSGGTTITIIVVDGPIVISTTLYKSGAPVGYYGDAAADVAEFEASWRAAANINPIAMRIRMLV